MYNVEQPNLHGQLDRHIPYSRHLFTVGCQLTPLTPKHSSRAGTPTDASAVMVAHRLLSSSAIRSNDDSDWPVHSSMLPFRNL